MTELLRRHSCLFPEESAEIRGIREVEVVGYFLHGLLRILEQRNTFANNGLENQFLHRISTDGFGQHGQVFGRQAKFIGIELHTALLFVMLLYQLDQADKDIMLAPHRSSFGDELAIVDRTKPIRKSQ